MPGDSAPIVAVYISAHGYGHCIRIGTVLERLIELRPVRLRVASPAPRRLWPKSLGDVTMEWRTDATDAGVVEQPDLSVDRRETRNATAAFVRHAERYIERELDWLDRGADLVVADVPPLPVAAAARLGLPSVAVANFSWDWIYARLGLDEAAAGAESCYRQTDLLVEAEPSAPMEAFPSRIRCGVISRRSRLGRYVVRERLGVQLEHRLVLVATRPGSGSPIRLPPPMPDVRYLLAGPPDSGQRRDDRIVWPKELAFVDLVAASDVVVCKPGYGIIGDVCGAGTRFLFTDGTDFPEHDVLRRWLAGRPGTRPVELAALESGQWGEQVAELLAAEAPEADHGEGAMAAAQAIAARLPS